MMIEFEWEEITNCPTGGTFRAKVIGGWIVNTVSRYKSGVTETSIFVPDAGHQWEILRN